LQLTDHALIGNGRSAALVGNDGSIEWLCWPRFDSPAVFSALTDAARGGRFRVGPASAVIGRLAYADDSNVLVTRFEPPGGRLTLIDAMLLPSEDELIRRQVPDHQLVRRLTCDEGAVEVEVFYQPRLGDGHDVTLLGERPLDNIGDGSLARFVLRAGESVRFVLCSGGVGTPLSPAGIDSAVQRTNHAWRNIAQRVGRSLHCSPENGHIVGDNEAAKLWRRDYEKGWEPKA